MRKTGACAGSVLEDIKQIDDIALSERFFVDYMGHNGGNIQLQHPVRLLLVAMCTRGAVRSENEIIGVDKHTNQPQIFVHIT
jgi:hypothetical protein